MKYLTRVRNVNVESEQSEDSLTKRSYPDLKHLTRLEMSSPDLSEVRVQRLTSVASVSANPNQVRVQRLTPARSVNANPNVVRVRPHKRSGANLKRRTSAQCVSANPNVVRVQAGIQTSFPSQEIFWTPAFARVTDLNYLRVLIQVSTSVLILRIV